MALSSSVPPWFGKCSVAACVRSPRAVPARCGARLPGSTSPLALLLSLSFVSLFFNFFFFELCSLQCENHSMTEAWEVFVCFSFILLKKKFLKHLIVVTSFT